MNTAGKLGIVEVFGLDLWGGDYCWKNVKNYEEALTVAKDWVTDFNKSATYVYDQNTIYLKYTRETNSSMSKSGQHAKCTSFIFGKII